jgi:hypothetical protein
MDKAKVTTIYMPFSEEMIKKHFADVKEAGVCKADGRQTHPILQTEHQELHGVSRRKS